MRLDHLLSKEHLAPSGVQAPDLSERLSRLAHGWNIDIGAEPNGSNSVHLLQIGTVRTRKPRTCTLLGPEGPGADRVSFLELVVVGVCSSGPLLCLPVGGCGGGTARTLRTTQWTRASSEHLRVFGEDDLKDH